MNSKIPHYVNLPQLKNKQIIEPLRGFPQNLRNVRLKYIRRQKIQNKFWYKIWSPPPKALKNLLFQFQSVKNIIIAAANTGNEKMKRLTEKKIDYTRVKVIYVFNSTLLLF